MLHRPFVLLIDDGELEDVAKLLSELGVRPTRLVHGAERRGWRQPERLLIVSGARALRLPHPEAQERTSFTKIAVVDRPSKTLRARIERMGFDQLICRPVHPEALRLLIESALHGGREQRSRPRFPVGCEVAWRSGLRRRRATLAEISSRGCRLLVREATRPPRLSLLLPRELAGGRELRIPGHVVRYERKAADLVSLTVVFDPLDAADQARLWGFLSGLEVGPPTVAA